MFLVHMLFIEVLSHVLLVLLSRVHISSVTLEHLNGAYKVEAGDGQSRDSYLKEHGIVTYLVINPKVQYHQNKGVSLVLIAIRRNEKIIIEVNFFFLLGPLRLSTKLRWKNKCDVI